MSCGRVEEVVQRCLGQSAVAGEAVHQAVSYYLNNKERMRYPEYRARGIQIGSGTVESGCKRVIGERLRGRDKMEQRGSASSSPICGPG